MNTNIIQHDPVILRLMDASKALTEAKSIQHTKSIVDVAAAAEIYAKRQQLGEDAVGIAHSIKIEALRKLGEMLKDAPKNTGAAGIGTSAVPKENRTTTPTLADLGLDKKTSSIAQKLAELPDDAFEQVKDGHQTVANAIMAVSKSKTPTEKKVEKETDQEEARRAQDELREQELGLLDQRIIELEAEIERLKEVLAIGIIPEEDQEEARALIADLKRKNETLEASLRGTEKSRDYFQNENAQMKRQISLWKNKYEKLKKETGRD